MTLRWLQVVLVLGTAASSSVSSVVSAARNDFSMITVHDDSSSTTTDNTDSNTTTSSYAVPDATAELLTDLFLPAAVVESAKGREYDGLVFAAILGLDAVELFIHHGLGNARVKSLNRRNKQNLEEEGANQDQNTNRDQ
jgi:hypothetical protein